MRVNSMCDQYPSKKKSIILLLRHGLERVDKSILKCWENPFQLSMHFRVIEFNPYFVVDRYGVNIQPNLEFTVFISCTSLIFLKYGSKQALCLPDTKDIPTQIDHSRTYPCFQHWEYPAEKTPDNFYFQSAPPSPGYCLFQKVHAPPKNQAIHE